MGYVPSVELLPKLYNTDSLAWPIAKTAGAQISTTVIKLRLIPKTSDSHEL